MKKAIVVTAAAIILAGLAIPFAGGLIMERSIRRAFEDVNAIHAATGSGCALQILDYDRSYLTSDIEWRIDLGALTSFYSVEAVVFRDHAEHGFTGVVSTTSLQGNPWYAAFVAEKLQGRDPLHITTRYGLTGGIENTVVLDAFAFMADDARIDVKAGRMAMATDRALRAFTASADWAGLTLDDTVTIGPSSMASNLKMFSPYLWEGDIRFLVQEIAVRKADDRFRLEGMQGRYLLKVNDDRTAASWDARFAVEGMRARDLAVRDASVRLAVSGLDVAGYEAFMKIYVQNVSQVLGTLAAVDETSEAAREAVKQQMAMIGFQMMAAYEKLLKQGLEFKIADLHARFAEGEIKGGATLRLLKDMTFLQFAPIVSQPERLFDILYLKSDLSLPASLVGERPQLLTPLYPGMPTGLFVRSGHNLVHQAETVDGKLIMNQAEVMLPGQGGVRPTSAGNGRKASRRL